MTGPRGAQVPVPSSARGLLGLPAPPPRPCPLSRSSPAPQAPLPGHPPRPLPVPPCAPPPVRPALRPAPTPPPARPGGGRSAGAERAHRGGGRSTRGADPVRPSMAPRCGPLGPRGGRAGGRRERPSNLWLVARRWPWLQSPRRHLLDVLAPLVLLLVVRGASAEPGKSGGNAKVRAPGRPASGALCGSPGGGARRPPHPQPISASVRGSSPSSARARRWLAGGGQSGGGVGLGPCVPGVPRWPFILRLRGFAPPGRVAGSGRGLGWGVVRAVSAVSPSRRDQTSATQHGSWCCPRGGAEGQRGARAVVAVAGFRSGGSGDARASAAPRPACVAVIDLVPPRS